MPEMIWRICAEYVDPPAPRPAIARAIGAAQAVFDVNLEFDADGVPYPQHANIVGWFIDRTKPQEESKSFRKQQAQRIVAQMTCSSRPS